MNSKSDSKSSRSSNSRSGDNEPKRLKSYQPIDAEINDVYRNSLDQLKVWYNSGEQPTSGQLSDNSDVRLITNPFKLFCFNDFIKSDDFLNKLKVDIKQLDVNIKNNDLYRLKQSIDLNNIETGSVGQLCQLFRQTVKPFVESLTNITLNDNIALTVSRYEQNDYLLCHDDDIDVDGRRIAFILYLVPDWDKSDGGLLELFDSNDNGEPTQVVESLTPKWNSFAFFEVGPRSWHQVSEVVSDSKFRLSVNGWFHGQPLVRPKRYIEPQFISDPATDVPLDVVKSWINPLYLNDSTQIEVQTRFEHLSEIVLQDFFNADKYQELARALNDSEAIDWRWNRPPNMRKYETAQTTSCPAIVLEAFELFKSEAMFLILSNMTGLKLHELTIANGSDDEDSNDSIDGNPRCRGEIRRWSHSCYTLMHDNSAELNEGLALDVILHCNCDNEFDRENGGFMSYIAKGEDEELLTVDPNSNCLNIVYRDRSTARFVKYINNKCIDSFHDLSFVYYK